MRVIFSLAASIALNLGCVVAQEPKIDAPPKSYSSEGATPLSAQDLERLKLYPFDMVICKINIVPDGYVIVGQGSSVSCPGGFPNTWTIRQPGATDTICKVSPMLPNYVITGEGSSAACPGGFPNTWSIRRA